MHCGTILIGRCRLACIVLAFWGWGERDYVLSASFYVFWIHTERMKITTRDASSPKPFTSILSTRYPLANHILISY